MHWTSDRTGRFVKRPSYSIGALEHLAEQLIITFLAFRHHHVAFPVATDDLTALVEYLGATLDLSAELSANERVVHGCTEFLPGHRPLVRIARPLSAHSRYAYRLRTTLAHACGHVWLHRPRAGARSRVGYLLGSGHRLAYYCPNHVTVSFPLVRNEGDCIRYIPARQGTKAPQRTNRGSECVRAKRCKPAGLCQSDTVDLHPHWRQQNRDAVCAWSTGYLC